MTDYNAIQIPEDKDRTEYTTEERRADLLQRVLDAGSPHALNQAQEAREYGVDPAQVCRDMDKLSEYISETIGDDAELTARAVFEQTLSDLRDADDWRASKAAFDVAMEWQEWLQATGQQRKEPDRLAVETETDAVRVTFGE